MLLYSGKVWWEGNAMIPTSFAWRSPRQSGQVCHRGPIGWNKKCVYSKGGVNQTYKHWGTLTFECSVSPLACRFCIWIYQEALEYCYIQVLDRCKERTHRLPYYCSVWKSEGVHCSHWYKKGRQPNRSSNWGCCILGCYTQGCCSQGCCSWECYNKMLQLRMLHSMMLQQRGATVEDVAVEDTTVKVDLVKWDGNSTVVSWGTYFVTGSSNTSIEDTERNTLPWTWARTNDQMQKRGGKRPYWENHHITQASQILIFVCLKIMVLSEMEINT